MKPQQHDWWLDEYHAEQTIRPNGSRQRCDRCKFWMQCYLFDTDHPDDRHGECRRHAPAPIQETLSMIGRVTGAVAWACEETANIQHDTEPHVGTDYTFEGADQYEVGQWPRTSGGDWCGDFQLMAANKLAKRKKLAKQSTARMKKEKAERENKQTIKAKDK